MGALVFFFFQNLGRAHQLAGPIRERRTAMGSERGGRQLQFLLNLRRGKRFESLQDFTGRGINGRYRHANFLPSVW